MQPILLLLLLMTAEQPDLKRSIRQFLTFYRENRALLTALFGALQDPTAPHAPSAHTAPQPEACAAQAQEHENDRPQTDGHIEDILAEYLKAAR